MKENTISQRHKSIENNKLLYNLIKDRSYINLKYGDSYNNINIYVLDPFNTIH